jgi:hypothetical protein
MARQNTGLEAEGAEFLVTGQLLIQRINAYKTYTNMPGYDIIVANPEKDKTARVQVKSRWETGANGFPIKNFDCDFVVAVLLNRGSKNGKKEVLPPEYFVFPVDVIQSIWEPGKFPKVLFKNIPNIDAYRDNWQLIKAFVQLTD